MDLKTYRSNSMAGALAEVKKDLGPDAVILRTRNYKAGGVMGFGGNTVVEITAARETPAGSSAGSSAGSPNGSPNGSANGRPRAPGEPFDAETIERMRAAAHAKMRRQAQPVSGQPSSGQPDSQHTISRARTPANGGAEFKPFFVDEIDEAGSGETPTPRSNGSRVVSRSQDRSGDHSRDPYSGRPRGEPAGNPLDRVPAAHRSAVEPTRVSFKPQGERAHADLEAELASIRELVSDVLRTTRKTAIRVEGSGAFAASAVSTNDPLYSLYGTLCDNEVPTDLADEIVGEVRNGLDPSESHEPAIIRESALRSIASRIPIASKSLGEADRDENGQLRLSPQGPAVQALIGPTGVGKTTTIAKLAASYKLRHGKKVGLITADTYRIAAVDQLRTYAGIIGIPLEIALAPGDIRPAIAKFGDCDVVLVDTPGRSPRDAARLGELSAVLDELGPARKHLVLSAGASLSGLRAAARCFGGMDPDALIVSKADEAGALGVLLEIARLTDLPLSYLTTGQEVPDDIEPARADRLARAVLEGGLPG